MGQFAFTDEMLRGGLSLERLRACMRTISGEAAERWINRCKLLDFELTFGRISHTEAARRKVDFLFDLLQYDPNMMAYRWAGKDHSNDEELKRKEEQSKRQNAYKEYERFKYNPNDFFAGDFSQFNFGGYTWSTSTSRNSSSKYFSDCKTKEDAKKKYRELVKKLHPDRGGKSEEFVKMQKEYDALIF